MRDDDIRNAIKDILEATDAFSGVFKSGLPENFGFGASELAACVVEPDVYAFSGHSDSIPGGLKISDGRAVLTILVRNQDPDLRDRQAERLLGVIQVALDGTRLGDMLVPQHSFVKNARMLPATPPERRLVAYFTYQYLVQDWKSVDTSE